MLCVVYVLRRTGGKLPVDVVRAHPHVGWLYLGRDTRKAFPQEACRLFRDGKTEVDVIEPLVHPSVKTIQRGGILIVGKQEVRSSVLDRQAWWVVPGPLDDLSAPSCTAHGAAACTRSA